MSDIEIFLGNQDPNFIIHIDDKEISIKVFFSMGCFEKYFELCEIADYRSAFAWMIYYMFSQSSSYNEEIKEDDFLRISDDELKQIIQSIISDDTALKDVFERVEVENIYEKFFLANKLFLKESTEKIKKSVLKASKALQRLNSPLIGAMSRAAQTFVFPPEHFQKIQLAIVQMPKIDFSYLQNAMLNIPKFDYPQIASLVANIPKMNFDIPAINSHITELLAGIQAHNAALAHAIQSPLIDMVANANSMFSKIDFSLLTYHRNWSEKHETMLSYGWFYLNELPDDILDEIHENKDHLSKDEVNKKVIDYFRNERCVHLKRIVKQWKSSPYFVKRHFILHEALVNHSRGYFNTSTTLLTLHTEGVITDFVRIKLQNPRFKVAKAIEDIEKQLLDAKLGNGGLNLYDLEIYTDIIDKVKTAFNEGFEHSNPDKTSNQSRDKIAHGHAVEKENEVNSLKHFLYLNEIFNLFSMLDEA